MTDTVTRGRPQASSREMLQEAAFELFLEQGYARTTVEHIARRAGVSRNTFFNYFSGKSDVFWIDLDFSRDALRTALSAVPADTPAMEGVRDAVLSLGAHLGPGTVPWALTHHEMIGGAHELQAAATGLLTTHVRVLTDFLTPRIPVASGALLARAAGYATVGAAVSAAQSWAAAGTSRGELTPYLEVALAPVVSGFQSVFDQN